MHYSPRKFVYRNPERPPLEKFPDPQGLGGLTKQCLPVGAPANGVEYANIWNCIRFARFDLPKVQNFTGHTAPSMPWREQRTHCRIFTVTTGKSTPDKKLMLLVHGFPELWAMWEHQMKYFRDKYTVAAIDMRGYGLSSRPSVRLTLTDILLYIYCFPRTPTYRGFFSMRLLEICS